MNVYVSVRDALASLALLSIPALALRTLWIARFDTPTALALIQYTSLPVFIASNVVILAPVFSTGVGVALYLYQQARFPIRSDSKLTWVAAGASYLAFLLLALPLILQADTTSVFGPLILPLFILSRASPNDGFLRWFGWSMIALLAFEILYRQVIWLLAENVQFASNTRTLYVLSIQVPDVITYDQNHNLIERFPISSIKHRAFCDIGPTGSIAEQLFGRPAIESCVDFPHADSVASLWSTSAAYEIGQQPRNYAFWLMR